MRTINHEPQASLFKAMILLAGTYVLLPAATHAQCSGGSSGGTLSPAPTASYQSMSVTAGNYYTFTVSGSGCFPTYYFSFCSADGGNATFDTQITILNNSGTYAGGYNDDNCSLQSYLVWTPAAAGTYRVLINKYNCTTGGSGTLAYKSVSTMSVSGDGFSVVDDAVATGSGCVTLTPNSTNQRGCAWDVNSPLNFGAGFSYDFIINLGSSDGGADGMSFVMQNDPKGLCACGAAGGGMGAAGITNSLVIELDTYLNAEDRDDGMSGVLCSGGAEPDHLDIWTNGNVNPAGDPFDCTPPGARVVPNAVPLMNGGSNYNIENGNDHVMRIVWMPGSPGTITVSILNTAKTATYGTISYSFDPLALFGTTTPYYGLTASTGALTNQHSFCVPPALLPVDLLSLESECRAQEAVHLKWESATERNNHYYTIERSDDGQVFHELAKIQGAGNSNMRRLYEWTDKQARPGTNYYRLKQTAYSGNTMILRSITERCGADIRVRFSQADRSAITVEIIGATEQENISVQLYDILGRKIIAESIEVAANRDNRMMIRADGLTGVYIVSVTGKAFSVIQKVMIW